MDRLIPATDDKSRLRADVLVIGGGPAGCWAALDAARGGARVVLAEKGFVGTSGATAAGNTTIIDTVRGSREREASVAQRMRLGHGLVERAVLERVLDSTHESLSDLESAGYRFPRYESGAVYRGMLRGVDYLRFLRGQLRRAGVRTLDQSPAEALLLSGDAVSGAEGRSRLDGRRWQVTSGAVVLATGGCAFLSGALGTNNLTGDGYLMAAEAGAALSGMEFTGQYGIAPAHSSVTKGIVYFWASFSLEDGTPIDTSRDRVAVARHLRHGPVYAVLDRAPPRLREGLRAGQPNILAPFDRVGIDPFTQRFPITLRHEGTVRGTGGLVTDANGATGVPGLYAAGDASSREAMSGATSGGGGPNAAWALATGRRAGQAAAAFARGLGAYARTRATRSAAPEPQATADTPPIGETIQAIKAEILPLDRGFFRSAERLRQSAARLAALRSQLTHHRPTDHRDALRAREAAALLATARWVTEAALARDETRGVHRREDRPEPHPAPPVSLHVGGVAQIWVRPRASVPKEIAV